jgi:hypothetical protein
VIRQKPRPPNSGHSSEHSVQVQAQIAALQHGTSLTGVRGAKLFRNEGGLALPDDMMRSHLYPKGQSDLRILFHRDTDQLWLAEKSGSDYVILDSVGAEG